MLVKEQAMNKKQSKLAERFNKACGVSGTFIWWGDAPSGTIYEGFGLWVNVGNSGKLMYFASYNDANEFLKGDY